ncbi:MAG: serine/threonine protein kinase [Planctomycetaceae bacterium]|jgi:serine/threonine protein kinase|nr:serine/threonine protein kinase [Planctomycetaceae bacterium]
MDTVSEFIDLVRRSGIADEVKLTAAVALLEKELTSEQRENPRYVADQFVRQSVLTAWQARQLLKGRYKGFFLRQYKILGHIGSGGMSSVYLAEHILMQRRVAIKVLPRKRLEKAIFLERFIREAQAIASLDHPNIIRAYDFDHEGDLHYIIMEYFPGDNLQTIIDREGKVPFPRIVNILRQTADALAHAHAVGVIHRDVKPSNILVNRQGEVKILDLGLALLNEQVYEGRITHIQEDTILGTADYLAPEQAIDSHKVDARADIYALGGVLYFCLTGHAPFPEGSVSKRLLDHQQTEPADILLDRPDTPADLVALCRKMMAKKPVDRQQSAREAARDFENWLIANGYAETDEFDRFPTPAKGTGKFRVHFGLQKIKPESLAETEDQLGSSVFAAAEENVNLFGNSEAEGSRSASDSRMFTQTFRRNPASSITQPVKTAAAADGNLPSAENVQGQGGAGHAAPADWYRYLPVWFWTLFFAGYIAAVFFAGILAALLMVFFGVSPAR